MHVCVCMCVCVCVRVCGCMPVYFICSCCICIVDPLFTSTYFPDTDASYTSICYEVKFCPLIPYMVLLSLCTETAVLWGDACAVYRDSHDAMGRAAVTDK